jgi:hypothetical protein
MAHLKVLIAIHSQLLQEMLAKVLSKIEDFSIVQVLNDLNQLPDVIIQTNPDWVLLASETRKFTLDQIDDFISTFPEICFVEIALDRDQATFHWLNANDLEVSNLTLEEFITILESGCICQHPHELESGDH